MSGAGAWYPDYRRPCIGRIRAGRHSAHPPPTIWPVRRRRRMPCADTVRSEATTKESNVADRRASAVVPPTTCESCGTTSRRSFAGSVVRRSCSESDGGSQRGFQPLGIVPKWKRPLPKKKGPGGTVRGRRQIQLVLDKTAIPWCRNSVFPGRCWSSGRTAFSSSSVP